MQLCYTKPILWFEFTGSFSRFKSEQIDRSEPDPVTKTTAGSWTNPLFSLTGWRRQRPFKFNPSVIHCIKTSLLSSGVSFIPADNRDKST